MNAPMIPDSTSPVPAVASRVDPASASRTPGWPGSVRELPRPSPAAGTATAVSEPFKRTTAPTASASRWAAAMRSGPGASPTSPRYSPSCGVSTAGTPISATRARAAAVSPRANRASASMTTGAVAATRTRRISATVESSRPRPGPTTTARQRSMASIAPVAHHSAGRARRTASRGQAAGCSRPSVPGTARRTMPAPACDAPDALRAAAPSIPGEPATTPTAADHLCDWAARAGRSAERSSSSTRPTVGSRTPTPMSSTRTSPASTAPSPWTRPRLRAAKVAVRVAGRGRPPARPVSPSTPEGMSTASTGVPGATCGAS